jgi:hypothetical protein
MVEIHREKRHLGGNIGASKARVEFDAVEEVQTTAGYAALRKFRSARRVKQVVAIEHQFVDQPISTCQPSARTRIVAQMSIRRERSPQLSTIR